MEQLDYLWHYQKLDLIMDELENKKKTSAVRKELYRSIQYLKRQQTNLEKISSDVDKKHHIYNRIYHEFQNIKKSLGEDEILLNSGDIKSFKQLDQLERKLSETQELFNEKKEELIALLKDMDSLNEKLQAVSRRLRDGKAKYDKNKKEYDLETKDLDTKYNDIKSQREKLKEKLDDSLLNKYQTVKSKHTDVMAEIDQDRCGGCNMTLASLVIQNVKDKAGVIECENCGRILYPGESISAS